MAEVNKETIKHPFLRIREILDSESRDIWAIIVYGILVSLLALVVPVAIQALVNSVAYGQLTQQLFVMSVVVFLVLGFAGFFSSIQYYYIELLQRRLFTRYALDLAYRIPRLARHGVREKFGVEFANPFLEIVVLHKSLAHILLEGLGLILQVIVGVILLAVYHPLLLVFSILLLIVIFIIFIFGGRNGIITADKECSAKYSMLSWLEDMARMPIMFHSSFGESFGLTSSDLMVRNWLDARSKHFKIVFRQNISMFAIHAISSALLLGLGGVLVIKGQLSLGQLVASELVLNTALSGLSKFGKHLESYYDLMAALRKLDNLRSVPLETEGNEAIPDSEKDAATLEIRDLSIIFADSEEPLLNNINLNIKKKEDVVIFGQGSSGKTVLLDCIYGLYTDFSGQIKLDGYELRDITRRSLRTRVGLIGEPEFFNGTLEENLLVGTKGVNKKEIRDLLDIAGLDRAVSRLPEGLQSVMLPHSGLFSRGELVKLSILRTVLANPGLIILDQSLDTLDPTSLEQAMNLLLQENRNWSILTATSDTNVVKLFSSKYEIKDGKLSLYNYK
jgi:putative ABC transport system ATP-binding protein